MQTRLMLFSLLCAGISLRKEARHNDQEATRRHSGIWRSVQHHPDWQAHADSHDYESEESLC